MSSSHKSSNSTENFVVEEIFASWCFDRKNCENFCPAKISRYMVLLHLLSRCKTRVEACA